MFMKLSLTMSSHAGESPEAELFRDKDTTLKLIELSVSGNPKLTAIRAVSTTAPRVGKYASSVSPRTLTFVAGTGWQMHGGQGPM